MSNYGNSGSLAPFDSPPGPGPSSLRTAPFHHLSQLLILAGLVILGSVVFAAASILLCKLIFGVSIGGPGTIENATNDPAVMNALKLMQAFTSIGTFVVPAIVFCFIRKKDLMETTRLNHGFTLPVLLLSLSVLLFASPLIGWMIDLNEQLDLPEWLHGTEVWMRNMEVEAGRITAAFMMMSGPADLLVNLFIVALLPAICEEMLFRGICIPFFREWTGNKHAAIWITAILFSLIHMQFYGFFPRMMLGVLLGYVFVWSGSLWVPLIVHFINNGLIVIMAYLMKRPEIRGLEDIPDNSGWMALGSAVLVGGLMYLLFRNRYREPAIQL